MVPDPGVVDPELGEALVSLFLGDVGCQIPPCLSVCLSTDGEAGLGTTGNDVGVHLPPAGHEGARIRGMPEFRLKVVPELVIGMVPVEVVEPINRLVSVSRHVFGGCGLIRMELRVTNHVQILL